MPTQPIPTQGRLDQRLSDHRQAWVEAAPLLFGGACAPLATAVEDMAELVALTTPLRRFEASSPDGRLFYRACTEVVGNLAITHAVHTGIVAGLEARGAGVELRLYGCDPDVAEAKARELGFTILAGSIDKPHGLRECVILDDDGYAWVPAVALRR